MEEIYVVLAFISGIAFGMMLDALISSLTGYNPKKKKKTTDSKDKNEW